MTREQIYHRRLARRETIKNLPWAIQGSPFEIARQAAWHAFQAHPELREISSPPNLYVKA